MKYFIFPDREIHYENTKAKFTQHGFAVVFDTTNKCFTEIIRLTDFRKIPIPLRRSIKAENLTQLPFFKLADFSVCREVRRTDFRELAKTLIDSNRPPRKKTVFLQNNRIFALEDRHFDSHASIIKLEKDFFRSQLNFHKMQSLGRQSALPAINHELKSLLKSANTCFFSEVFDRFTFVKNNAKCEYRCVLPGTSTRMPPAHIRNVMVVTSLIGKPLQNLGQNLEFWSKGVTGYHWRHFYGKPDAKRLDTALQTAKPDAVIFRGHGFVSRGKLCWEIEGGLYFPKFNRRTLYVHLSCLDKKDTEALKELPAGLNLVPLNVYPDMDDTEDIRRLFTEIKSAMAFHSLVEKFCLGHKWLIPVYQ